MANNYQTVGVIGGMGPAATIDFLRRVLDATPAQDDRDHIRTLVDNNPGVPSRIDVLIHGRGESPIETLVSMAKGLEAQGADFLVMPCNTAHLYAPDIAAAVDIPMISLIDMTVAAARAEIDGLTKVGLLASTAVHQTAIYAQAFHAFGVDTLEPDAALQTALMDLIMRIKAGAMESHDTDVLEQAVDDLAARGAQCIVVACTEISTIAALISAPVPMVDASQALAEASVRRATTP